MYDPTVAGWVGVGAADVVVLDAVVVVVLTDVEVDVDDDEVLLVVGQDEQAAKLEAFLKLSENSPLVTLNVVSLVEATVATPL